MLEGFCSPFRLPESPRFGRDVCIFPHRNTQIILNNRCMSILNPGAVDWNFGGLGQGFESSEMTNKPLIPPDSSLHIVRPFFCYFLCFWVSWRMSSVICGDDSALSFLPLSQLSQTPLRECLSLSHVASQLTI